MNGLEALLFAVFVIFVLFNLLIRFVVRKSKQRQKALPEETVTEGYPETFAGAEEDVRWLPAAEEGYAEQRDAREQGSAVFVRPVAPYEEDDVISRRRIDELEETGTPAAQHPGPLSLSTSREEEKETADVSKKREQASLGVLEGTMRRSYKADEEKASFWDRMEDLPALQKAIVLSEVLGPPKGISNSE
jgi:hypothetical protein